LDFRKDTKERTKLVLEELQFSKDNNRKFVLVYNDLSRQYKLKMNQLDKKHLELVRLSADYSAKIQLKEEEEAKLKKDIAEIALAMNMEAMKAKTESHLLEKFVFECFVIVRAGVKLRVLNGTLLYQLVRFSGKIQIESQIG
jgi:hypothetical protein